MTTTIKSILDAIEEARRAGLVNNESARLASVALELAGDDALLANRIIAQGSDPASLEYLATGSISDPIRKAHRDGPGSLVGEDRDHWLFLASISVDENKGSTLRERVQQFVTAAGVLKDYVKDGFQSFRLTMIERKRREIAALPFTRETVGGREMRVYDADLGFAAAYWDGEPCAAARGVYNGKPYLAVGSNGTPLSDLGVKVTKSLSPCFGIIE